jgi:two-component system nitrate/nitrite response regulator NarL
MTFVPTKAFRVLVIADDPLARVGLATILENNPDCIVVGSLALKDLSVGILDAYRPDVALWDSVWEEGYKEPGGTESEMDSLQELAEYDIPLVALLADEAQGMDAWRIGARGLLFRDIDESELVAAIQAVVKGFIVIKPELGIRLFPSAGELDPFPYEPLTPREVEVIQLVAEGLPNKVIAQRLDVSEHTVKFHLNIIMKKLGAQSRTEAVVRAYRLGIIMI